MMLAQYNDTEREDHTPGRKIWWAIMLCDLMFLVGVADTRPQIIDSFFCFKAFGFFQNVTVNKSLTL